jgi:anion-transporting  ArsA/GET3 family ATPase
MAESKSGEPEILFVTGKGGVGKSIAAAAIAWRAAAAGRRTLLVEFGRRSFYERLFELAPGTAEMPDQPFLRLERWEEDACLREYVGHYVPIPRAADFFLDNRVIRALVRAAPTLKELALIGKATGPHRLRWTRTDRELIVIDSFSTGHFMALLRAPRGMHAAVPVGPVGRQTESIQAVLADPEKCRFVIVTLAEELPATEALELHAAIAAETGQRARIICNKVQPAADDRELARAARSGDAGAAEFARRVATLKERQRRWIRELRRADADALLWHYQYVGRAIGLVAALADEADQL